MHGHRLRLKFTFTVVCVTLIPLAVVATAIPAQAASTQCRLIAGAIKCYADAVNGDSQAYSGAFMTENNANMSLADYSQSQHINSEMWFITSVSPLKDVEIGLRKGVDSLNCCGGAVPYEAFWADTANGQEARHPIANYSPDGSNNSYEIQTDGADQYWNLYLNYNFAGQSVAAAGPVGIWNLGGSEISLAGALDPGTHSDTFNMYFEDLSSSSYTWYYWPSERGWRLDQGCGDWPVGYCQNWAGYYPYEWSWNKP